MLYTIAPSLKCPRCLPRLRCRRRPPTCLKTANDGRPVDAVRNVDGNGDNWRKYPSISMEICETNVLYICENHWIYCLTEKKQETLPSHVRMNERRHFHPPWHFAPIAECWKLSSSYAIILLRPPATLYRTISFLLLYIKVLITIITRFLHFKY